ncbi:hypothetical protein [Runella slithyformis]|uniref:Uncharacterized protein n=1 Tax=Runella slithyformis (strain ATCC 29530 / DSM 19594 / LMG 11500 / NCIMB 11436 / LSU 4) TaxID=761193 RepID=A0A7U3ZGF1_RUNSL|nr:hypothetical protein [Runella slithyformis]AEI46737.1 hypothetical protein Runsl_0285 [Runella slithyformis DSM 19594]
MCSQFLLRCDVLKKLFTFLLWVGAILQLYAQSTTFTPQVMVPPRLSYDALIAIPSPMEGSMVFDTTHKVVRVFKKINGFRWPIPHNKRCRPVC